MKSISQLSKIAALLSVGMMIATAASVRATTISATMTVDNGYTAYISTDDSIAGTLITTHEDWYTTDTFSATLTAGVTNYLHIRAYDLGEIAGFLGQFSLSDTGFAFSNDTQSVLTNVIDWQGNLSGFGFSYQPLTTVGTNGDGPWGDIVQIDGSANWIWVGDAYGNDESFFSLAITPTSQVPDGGVTAAMLGAALVGLVTLRRKLTLSQEPSRG